MISRPSFRPAIAALVIAFGAAACDSVEDRIAKHHERGAALLAEGDLDRAQIEFRNALKLDENHAPSRLDLARIQEQRGDLRAAMRSFRFVAEIDRENVSARVKTAQYLIMAGAIDEAKVFAAEAFELAPDDAEVLATRASIAFREGDATLAREAASRALERAPDNIPAHVVLVSLRFKDGDVDGALADLERVLGENPDDVTLNVFKLRILDAEGRQAAYGEQLLKMTRIFPDEPAYRRGYVSWLVSQGLVEQAEVELRELIRQLPDDTALALDLARFVGQLRGADAARAEIEAALVATEDPTRAFDLVAALSQLDLADGDRSAAAARIQAFLDANVENLAANQARLALARLALAEGDLDAAAALNAEVTARDPRNVDALEISGRISLQRDDVDGAIATIRSALDLEPDNIRLMRLEAQAQIRAGNFDIASERLGAAARQAGYAPEVSLEYANFLRARQRPDAAEELLREALTRQPDAPSLLAALAELRLARNDWSGAEEIATRLDALGQPDASANAGRIRAIALSGQGRMDDAIATLEARAATPDGGDAETGRLIVGYVRAGRIEDAWSALETHLAERGPSSAFLLLRAELNVLRGDVAAAEQDIRDVIALRPDDARGQVALARLRLAQGNAAEAEDILKAAIERVENPQSARALLAPILELRGAFREAIEQYEALYGANPENIIYANNLASLLAEQRADDPDSVARAARIAQRLHSVNVPEFQDTYGWTRHLIGESEGALRALIPAAEALPNNALVQYHLGRVYAALGRPADARVRLEAALIVDPSFPKADSAREALNALPAEEAPETAPQNTPAANQ